MMAVLGFLPLEEKTGRIHTLDMICYSSIPFSIHCDWLVLVGEKSMSLDSILHLIYFLYLHSSIFLKMENLGCA